MTACFWNAIHVGPGNCNVSVNGGATRTVANGVYNSFLSFRNAFMTAVQTDVATLRSGLTSTGYFTIDNNGGAAYTMDFIDQELGYLLGFTADLASANTHTAPRRIGASLYLEHGGGPTAATIGEHDPMPGLVHVTQTEALSGIRRTTRSGVRRKRTVFTLQFLDNTARFVSPSAAVATTYANAGTSAAYDIGLTQYEHAKYRWWDSTNISAQGWSDGRRLRYFSDVGTAGSGAAVYAQTAAAWAFTGVQYTDWTVDMEACQQFPGVKVRPPLTTKYHVTIPVCEFFE